MTAGILASFVVAYLTIPKTYPIYDQALTMAVKDDYVVSLLGDGIRDSLFAYSHINKGYAKIEVTLAGNKSKGRLLIRGRKVDNVWTLESVFLEQDTLKKRYLIYSGKGVD